MKTYIKKAVLAILLMPAPILMLAQEKVSRVEFEGENNIILTEVLIRADLPFGSRQIISRIRITKSIHVENLTTKRNVA